MITRRVAAPGRREPSASASVMIKVWDPFVRIFHWGLVIGFVTAWLTGNKWDRVHEWVGYTALVLVGLRIVWGMVGSKHARFRDFVRGPGKVIGYLYAMARGRERRYLGHNPAGGAMIIALLLGIIGLGTTGWMMGTTAYFGVGWVEEAHELIANAMLLLVALHISGVVYESIRHKENLVRAMVTGRKRRS